MPQDEITRETGEDSTRQELLDVLADPICRTMLRVISSKALTAPEVAERTDIPLSTVYRKFDRLVDTPFVEATYRLGSVGKHPRQYRCEFDRILIRRLDQENGRLEMTIR